ncbi:Lipopolysaccharide export system protein LptA [bacterium HR08]|nr:Lipopolysaccharide export system protein LptA [bacterium HR08]
MRWREPTWPRVTRALTVALFVAVSATLLLSSRQHQGLLGRRSREAAEARLNARLLSVRENIRHLHTQEGRPVFLLTAARDEAYDDGHHELSEVSLTLYAADGAERARVTARRAVSYQTTGLIIFATDVVAQTREGVRLRTDEARYDHAAEVLRTERPVILEHAGGWGESQGAEIRLGRDRRDLVRLRAVRLTIAPGTSEQAWTARADSASFETATLTFRLVGTVVMRRGAEELRAERLEGSLDSEHRIREVTAEGDVRLRSRDDVASREIMSHRLAISFTRRRDLARAIALGSVVARVWHRTEEYEWHSPRLEMVLAEQRGRLIPQSAWAEGGRVNVVMRSTGPERALAERRLEANRVEAIFRTGTRALHRLRASGDVRLEILPTAPATTAERKTILARQIEVEFAAERLRATTARAEGDVRMEIEPMGAAARPKRVLMSRSLLAQFDPETQEIARLLHSGGVRYLEGERGARSERASYDADSGWIRLRGGEPTVWDARGRTRADEVDVNPREQRSVARGRVLTTALPGEAGARALPFAARDAPIFIAADHLDVDHRERRARYTGAVRAWQQDTYLTADELEVREAERTLTARGQVRSFLFRARPTGTTETIPMVVSAARLLYREAERTILYEGGAHLRRGAQDLRAESLTIFLKPGIAEIERAIAERHVTLTDPDRRAYAERAVYEADGERIRLEGAPARLEDERHGVRQEGARLTFLGGSDTVVVEDGEGARRVRTVRTIPRGQP